MSGPRRWGVVVVVAVSFTNAACVRAGFGDGDANNDTPGDGAAARATFSATVAVCLAPEKPDPQACEASSSEDTLKVDGLNYNLGEVPSAAFMRFDPGTALVGHSIVVVTLELHTTDTPNASSDQTGEVWQVTPFAASDLSTKAPQKVGSAPVAADLGAVAGNSPVGWQLPPSLVVPSSPVTVGVYPVTNDSVLYWGTGGPVPPKLVVHYN